MKLGKKEVVNDPRTLKLSTYVSNWQAPAVVDYTNGITKWGMMLNDHLGCCTIAAIGHAIQVWSRNNVDGDPPSTIFTPPDQTILDYYEKWDGYDPKNPIATDNGGVELFVLRNWQNSDFSGFKLDAFVSVNPKNLLEVKHTISEFGLIYMGVELPVSAQNQSVWSLVPKDGGVWGGHAVVCPAYNAIGPICITWGELKQMTWDFWYTYVSEAYALFTDIGKGLMSKGPDGIDMDKINADLKEIGT